METSPAPTHDTGFDLPIWGASSNSCYALRQSLPFISSSGSRCKDKVQIELKLRNMISVMKIDDCRMKSVVISLTTNEVWM